MEPIEDVCARMNSLYDEILKTYPNKNILVVAHNAVGIFGAAYFNGMSKDNDFSNMEIKNAGVVTFNK